MTKTKWNHKFLRIALVCLMLGSMLGGLAGIAEANDDPSAEIDSEVLNVIDQYAPKYYNDEWNLTLEQYKAWIATITWGEAGKGGYAAHSQYGSSTKSLTGDRFDHVVEGNKFRFSTGIGVFQMDKLSFEGVDWAKEPTKRKMDPEASLLSVLECA